MKNLNKLEISLKKVPKSIYLEIENRFKILFKFRYPKIFALIIIIIFSYFIFSNSTVNNFINELHSLSYIGIFIAGMLFAFGFSAPFAVGFLITLNPSNIYLAAVIGGIGAVISDIFIFRYIRFSFKDEFNKLKDEKPIKFIKNITHKSLGLRLSNYLLFVLAGFAIASPLPDELGVIMLAGLTDIKEKVLFCMGFILNTIGIYIILALT